MPVTEKIIQEAERLARDPRATVRTTSAELWAAVIATLDRGVDTSIPGNGVVDNFNPWFAAHAEVYKGSYHTGIARVVRSQRHATWRGGRGVCLGDVDDAGRIHFDTVQVIRYTAATRQLRGFFAWLANEWRQELSAPGTGQLGG